MDERYYITDLEQKIIEAVKRASDTAEICSLLNRGTESGTEPKYAQVTRTDIECQLAGIIEISEINRLIDVYLEWFPETPAGEEFNKYRDGAIKAQTRHRVEILDYIDWLKTQAAKQQ